MATFWTSSYFQSSWHYVTHLSLCNLPGTLVKPDLAGDGLTDILKSFLETESLGIKEEPIESEVNPEPFLTNVKFLHEQYKVGLPWLRERSEMPDHYNLCFNPLKYLQRRLIKEPGILEEYQRLLNDQLSRSIIEHVTSDDRSSSSKTCVHCLPHHPVVKQNRSTTKVQIVYDRSATSHESPSLNDCLQVGPNLISKLFNDLNWFRYHPITRTEDIQTAFPIGQHNQKRQRYASISLVEGAF